MSETNFEAEKAAKEAAAREKIVALVDETIEAIGNEELRRYFGANEIADRILETSGRDLAEKARNYFDSEWLHIEGRINEMPPELQVEARDRVRSLSSWIEQAMREIERPRSKEEAQQELVEKFGMRKTSDFQAALQRGEVGKAEEWLQYIIDNKDAFPQYQSTWDSWLADRQKEIAFYKDFQEKRASGQKIEEIVPRTKEVAQMELLEKFGLRKTSDFQAALKRGDVETAKAWLQYIIDNRDAFPQYQVTWDSWLADRRRELTEAEEE